jgi:3-isopropylmalate/(R)-2-methylmalate dehydratase small subunit
MQPIKSITGIAAPLPLANLDTDQIMPKQFLRGIDKSGLARGLLHDLRHAPDGTLREDFVLNRPAYAGTRIIVGAPNFGCGSSREHAVWGLQQYGIGVVIAPSFGEIFYSNAMNNRLLAAQVSEEDGLALMAYVQAREGATLIVDIERATIWAGRQTYPFLLAPRHRASFLEGLDMIGSTLKYQAAIAAFAAERAMLHPWSANVARLVRDRIDSAGR